jgi:hypothetical protein
MMLAGQNLMASFLVPSFQERMVGVSDDVPWMTGDELVAKSLKVNVSAWSSSSS